MEDPTPDLRAELRRMATLRSPSALRDAHLPAFDALAGVEQRQPDRRLDDRRRAVERGLAAITDPPFRRAAEAVFGFGADRWRPMKHRATTAAAQFDCGYDAFRRKRSSGTSLYDDTIEALAVALGDRTEPRTADAVAEPVPAPLAPRARRRPSSPTIGVAAAVVVVAIVAAVVVGLRTQEASGRRPATPSSSVPSDRRFACPVQVGETMEDDRAPQAQRSLVGRAYSDQMNEIGFACPSGLARTWSGTELLVQPIGRPGDWTGMAVATPAPRGTSLLLSSAQWAGVVALLARTDPSAAADLVPLAERHDEGDSEVRFATGRLVGHDRGQPHFWLDGGWLLAWQRAGGLEGLGAPASDRYTVPGGQRQDFERGYLFGSSTGSVLATDNHADQLAVRAGDVVEQPDGLRWAITSDLRRRAIEPYGSSGCPVTQRSRTLRADATTLTDIPLGHPVRC